MEIWKPVVGAETYYMVSNRGRLMRQPYIIRQRAYIRRFKAKLLSPQANGNAGHVRTSLRYEDGKKRTVPLHRLILEAFVGPCPEGMEACHANGNPADNRLENLRWDTRLGNKADSVRLGEQPRNEEHHNCKLSCFDVSLIRKNAHLPHRILASMYKVNQSTISRIISGDRRAYATAV